MPHKADKAAGTVTAKNSNSRCLYRLTGIVLFLRVLLDKLLQSQDITLKVRFMRVCVANAWGHPMLPAYTADQGRVHPKRGNTSKTTYQMTFKLLRVLCPCVSYTSHASHSDGC